MDESLIRYIAEVVVGIILAILAWSFKSWSSALSQATDKILRRLDTLTAEFHKHTLEVERRVTRIETKVDMSIKKVEETNGKSKSN